MSIALEQTPTLARRAAELVVGRRDIWFENVAAERIRVEITVHNAGDEASEPTDLALQAAPLGAFVPWRPLTVLPVPAIGGGESVTVSTEVEAPQPEPLGSFDRVPPSRLLTAVSPQDRPKNRPTGTGMMRTLRSWLGRKDVAGTLPPSPFELLGRPGTHWAGNLNVFIGNRAVERHMARALRIYAGRTNVAAFIVGEKQDAYRFRLSGNAAHWQARLYDATSRDSLVIGAADRPVRESAWISLHGHGMMLLALCPPEDCSQGEVNVHVTQRSSGQEAIVEFSLDPSAAGPGCYTV